MEKKKWSDMKVILKWDMDDQYWMNPDNLLLILQKACPNTNFKCDYLIHPSKDLKKQTYFKIMRRYKRRDRKIDHKLHRKRRNDKNE